MRVLVDTQVIVRMLQGTLATEHHGLVALLAEQTTAVYASVASLWEIAIKTRLGKLDPGMKLVDLAGYLEAVGLTILPITTVHVVAAAEPEPHTRDPFDRLLLAVCQEENLKFATADRALRDHPLAVKI